MNYRERVGENIEYYRKQSNLTLKELAVKVGITEATMQKYEKGMIKRIDVEMCTKIAEALNTTPNNITGWLNKDDKRKAHEQRIQHRIDKYKDSYASLPFEKQKLVDNYIQQLLYGTNSTTFFEDETAIIDKYRKLDRRGKSRVLYTLDEEYNYCTEQKRKNG